MVSIIPWCLGVSRECVKQRLSPPSHQTIQPRVTISWLKLSFLLPPPITLPSHIFCGRHKTGIETGRSPPLLQLTLHVLSRVLVKNLSLCVYACAVRCSGSHWRDHTFGLLVAGSNLQPSPPTHPISLAMLGNRCVKASRAKVLC